MKALHWAVLKAVLSAAEMAWAPVDVTAARMAEQTAVVMAATKGWPQAPVTVVV